MYHHQYAVLPWGMTEEVMEEESVSRVAGERSLLPKNLQVKPGSQLPVLLSQRVSSIVDIRSDWLGFSAHFQKD